MQKMYLPNHKNTILETFRPDLLFPIVIIIFINFENGFLKNTLFFLGLLLLHFCFLYLTNNRHRLIIDDNSITSYSEWFGKQYFKRAVELDTNLRFVQLFKRKTSLFDTTPNYRVANYQNKLYLVNDKDVVYTLNTRAWKNMNKEGMIAKFEQLGFILEKQSTQQFFPYLKSEIPAQQDLGKRTGYLAYSSIALILATGLVVWLDSYRTLFSGDLFPYYMTFAVIIFLFSMKYMYHKKELIAIQAIVALLFSACVTFMMINIFHLVIPFFSSTEQSQFIKKTDEKWVHIDNASSYFYCRGNKSDDMAIGTKRSITTIENFSMIRVKKDEMCVR